MTATTYRHALLAAAWTLSACTAVSVGLAMQALIPSGPVALLAITAGVLLDLLKYASWPLAATLLAQGQRITAGMLAGCALLLAGVSAWATHDRLYSAMAGNIQHASALHGQRTADLQASITADRQHLQQLDAQTAQVQQQAAALRARNIVTQANQLEATALPRIAEQRTATLQRIDTASQELATIAATPAPAGGLPLQLATLLCLGFALALEIVPAVIITALRHQQPLPATEQPAATEQQPPAIAQQPAEPTELQPALDADDSHLLQQLADNVAATASGQLVRLRDFAERHGIGNHRAARIFLAATVQGLIHKNAAGRYIAA